MVGSFARNIGGRVRLLQLVALLVVLLLTVVWAPFGLVRGNADTAPLNKTLGNFEIDGNFYDGYDNASTSTSTASSTPPGALDWVNVLSAPSAVDPVGSADTTNFSVGSKECSNSGSCNPDLWSGGTGTASPKDDISNVYESAAVQPPGSTQLWGRLGVQRQGTNGTTFFDLEFNQLANHTNPNGISVPTRSVGDTLVVAQVQGSGSFTVSGTIQRWTNTQADCDAGLIAPCWTTPQSLDPSVFYGVSNDSVITNFPGASGGTTVAAREFAEMALNFSAVGAVLGCPSSGYSVTNIRTRSSITPDAALKDYVAAPVTIPSSCGELKIEKFGPDGTTPLAGAHFSVSPNPVPGGTGTYTGVTDANGVIDINPAVPGNYTVTETAAPPGYLLPSTASKTVTVAPFGSGADAAVVGFTDPLGSVTFTKVDGESGNALCCATFSITGPRNVTVTDNGTNDADSTAGTIKVTSLPTGDYTLTETAAPTGYNVSSSTVHFTVSQATPNPVLAAPTFSDPHILSTLTVKKTDTAGNPLAGAGFVLYQEKTTGTEDPSTDTSAGSCTTTLPTGECSVSSLDWGATYYWQEVTAPAGYNLPDHTLSAPITITAANAGSTFGVTTFTDTESSIATTATRTATLPNASISDSATVSGLRSSATGTVTFTLYGPFAAGAAPDCSTAVWTSSALPISSVSSGTATAGPASHTVTAAGTYYWIATYSGDQTGDRGVAGKCGDTGETSVVNPASPTITTSATASATLPGGTIADSATLTGYQAPLSSGGAADTVTFKLYGPSAGADCSTTAVFSDTVNISSGGTASSASYTPTSAGNYWWVATFNGDPNNNTATGACGATGEKSVVSPASPVITTSATGTASLPAGTISDRATLTGYQAPLSSGGAADTVTFKLYGPSAGADCSTTPVFSDTVNISSDGTASSGSYTPTAVGNYWWVATFNGDPNNNTATGACGATGEKSVVSPASPTITTSATPSVALPNGAVSDSATLSGFAAPLTQDGTANGTADTVTFNLYGPSASANCSTTAVFTDTEHISSTGTASSVSYTPTAVGNYWWVATFNGDPNNNTAAGACGATGEESVVTPATPTISTQAADTTATGGSIHDVATITGATANATGTVTFSLYPTSDCSGTPVFTSTVPLVGGTTATSDSYTVTGAASSYNWIAAYSGDANNSPVSGACNDAHETSHLPVLGLVKTANPPSGSVVQPGSRIDYTISVPNTGSGSADNVTVVDTLPADVTVVAGTITPASGVLDTSAGTITWSGLTVPVGGTTLTYSVTVDANAPQGATLVNTAVLGSLTSSTTHRTPTGALTLVKEVNRTSATFGDPLTYTLTASASGALAVQHAVTVSDVVPANTTYIAGSAACTGTPCTATYDASTKTVTWNLGDMNTGTSRVVTFKVTIDTPAAGAPVFTQVLNAGAVQSTETPSTPSNQVKTTIVAVAALVLHKAPKATLPFTGVDVPPGPASAIALTLLAAGAVLWLAGRRRRA